MPELHITLPDGRKTRHMLGTEPAVIGRDAGCDIPIDDPSSSRRHAQFSKVPGGYTVADMGSKNGTLVNNLPCDGSILQHGDEIVLGSTVLMFADKSVGEPSGVIIAEDDRTRTNATRYVGKEQRLVLSQRRLETLYELGGQLTALMPQQELLENAMNVCCEILHFERGAVGLKRRDGKTVDWPVVHNLRGAEGELTISRSLLSRAMEYGERAIFTDAGSANIDPTVSMVQHGIRSAMCVPLLHQDEVLGVIYGDRTSTSTPYMDEDIDFFAGIAQQISIGLVNARLLQDQKAMAALAHDVDTARKIQNRLLPRDLPSEGKLRVAALNDPGARVSGDYYDVIDCGNGKTWVLIADVTGEGVPAALLMANLQAAVRVTVGESDDPAELMMRWSNLIEHNTDPSKFVTAVLALVDPETGTISLTNAGHCPPVVVRESEPFISELEGEGGLPLGVLRDAQYVTETYELGTDPYALFLYTDGVIEAMSAGQELFETHRLLAELGDLKTVNPQTLVKQVRKRLSLHSGTAPQSDDITMLACRIG